MEVCVVDEKNYKNDRFDDEKEATCLDDTTPDDMEVSVGDKKNDMKDRFDDEKEAACLDDTTPDDMEVGVGDEKKMTRMIDLMKKKSQHAQMTLLLMICR